MDQEVCNDGARPMSADQWLLEAAPLVSVAVDEWATDGAAWLRPGALFGAIVLPADLVHAVIGLAEPTECAAPLAEVLDGGPVFYSHPAFGRDASYTVLVPAPIGMRWAMVGTVAHPYRALLRVPSPDVHEPRGQGPWWVAPPRGAGVLCPAHRLVALVELGREVRCEAHRQGGGGNA